MGVKIRGREKYLFFNLLNCFLIIRGDDMIFTFNRGEDMINLIFFNNRIRSTKAVYATMRSQEYAIGSD